MQNDSFKSKLKRLSESQGTQKALGFGRKMDHWIDAYGKWAWIALMILGLLWLPILGLLITIWVIWGKELFGAPPVFRLKQHRDKSPEYQQKVWPEATRSANETRSTQTQSAAKSLDTSLLHVSHLLDTTETFRHSLDEKQRQQLLDAGKKSLESALQAWPQKP